MAITTSNLGDLLEKLYSKQAIQKISQMTPPVWSVLKADEPRIDRLNEEWSVMRIGRRVMYVHHCPCGDIRLARERECELCKTEVPEGVRYLARVLVAEDQESSG